VARISKGIVSLVARICEGIVSATYKDITTNGRSNGIEMVPKVDQRAKHAGHCGGNGL